MKKVLEIDLQDNGVAAVFCDISSDREMSRLSAVMLALGYECEEFAIAMFAAADTLRINHEAVGEALAALKEETEREWRKPVFDKIDEMPDFGPHEDMVGRSVASWDYQEGFGDGYNEWEIHVFDVPED